MAQATRRNDNFEFKIIKNYGVISEGSRGWKRELNSVSWNGAEPKFDIRDWSPEHDKMGKGIAVTENELLKLRELIDNVFFDSVSIEFPEIEETD